MKDFIELMRRVFTEEEIQEIFLAAEERDLAPRQLIRQAVVQDLYR